MARYTGPVCRLCRREGMKLFLKGERCYTDKCAIEKRNVAAGPARPRPQGQDGRLRRAAAREAEGQAHLRRAREPVPPLLRGGGPAEGHHGRPAAADARAPARQRRLPAGLRDVAGRRRGSSSGTGTSRSTAGRWTSRRMPCAPGDTVAVRATSSAERDDPARDGRSEGPRRAGVAARSTKPRSRVECRSCRRASRSICRCRNS